MLKDDNLLTGIIDQIYSHNQQLLPFLPVLRKSIASLKFTDDGNIPTAEIQFTGSKFHIRVNREFVYKYKLNSEDLAWVVVHEISHFLQNHLTNHDDFGLNAHHLNIVQDMQVNSMLYQINNQEPISLFYRLNQLAYPLFLESPDTNSLEFLLFPPHKSRAEISADLDKQSSFEPQKRVKLLNLWFDNYKSSLSLAEIVSRLKEIFDFPPESADSEESNTQKEINELLSEELLQLQKELSNYQQNYLLDNSNPFCDFLELEQPLTAEQFLNRRLNVLKHSLSKVFCKNSKRTVINEEDEFFRSIVPHFGRRETALLSCGLTPAFFPQNLTIAKKEQKFAAVYIDFSDSAEEYKNTIYRLLLKLTDIFSGPYFLFATQIREVALSEVKNGSTISGGTDISCVYEHITANKFSKALIITDGEFKTCINGTEAELYAVLYSSYNSYDALEQTGRLKKVWYLDR